ncbi:hypothetical protein [Streptomyces sp. NBC_00258]|uniref:hypothetical protein n=1 Tax=Streptomyces sp. NBC_00258 TaxID=2903642 RepID=UPI002E2957AE|nr:hypothetical protein [Streptomyces sp. NBC_00258]
MKWRRALATAAWVALGTGAGGLAAWQLASADADTPAHGRALDDAAVRRALAQATPTGSTSPEPSGSRSHQRPTSSSRPPSSPNVSTPPGRETLRFTGGTATVECRADGTVYLLSWSPDDGYAIDEDVQRGPAPVARLEAEPTADGVDDLAYDITCTPAGARAQPMADADD